MSGKLGEACFRCSSASVEIPRIIERACEAAGNGGSSRGCASKMGAVMSRDAEYRVIEIAAREFREYAPEINALASRFQTSLVRACQLSREDSVCIDESPATIQFTVPDCGLRVAVISDIRCAEQPVARLLTELKAPLSGTAFLFLPEFIHLEVLGPIDQKLNSRGIVVLNSAYPDNKQMKAEAKKELVNHADTYFHKTVPHMRQVLSHAS